MVHNLPETLGEIIKTAREKSDLTVEELTARVGISERYLYRIENEGKVPKFDVLKNSFGSYPLMRTRSSIPRSRPKIPR